MASSIKILQALTDKETQVSIDRMDKDHLESRLSRRCTDQRDSDVIGKEAYGQGLPSSNHPQRDQNAIIVIAAGDRSQNDIEDLDVLERTTSSGPTYSSFTIRQKRWIVFLASWGGFFSTLASNIYFPALNALAKDLNVTDGVINLTLTSYMIFQGLAPTIFGDIGDMRGRRPAYILGFVIFIGANIGLALQNSYAALFVLRCLQSTGSSGTVALGNGVVVSGFRGILSIL